MQPYCPLLGTSNRTLYGINIFDYDHFDNNNNNYEEDNCNPISLIAHRIKTKNPSKYGEIMNDIMNIQKFRLDNLIEYIEAMKRDNMIDGNVKETISSIMYR